MSMMSRRAMMGTVSAVNGWKKRTVTATETIGNGATFLNFISPNLPESYRYAIAVRSSISDLIAYDFIGAIFLPTRTAVHIVRMASDGDGYYQNGDGAKSSITLKITTGTDIDIYWRDEPIADDATDSLWNYTVLQPSEDIMKANAVATMLDSIGAYDVEIAVADLDFNTVPSVDSTYCESIRITSPSVGGLYVRYRNDAYAVGGAWQNTYDLKIPTTTKIAVFYF